MRLLIILLLTVFSSIVYGQVLIKGKIVDDLGNPVNQSTISTADKRTSTFSDKNGLFEVNVSQNDTILLVSNLGYAAQHVEIKGQTYLTILLRREIHELQEIDVFHTGYQTIPKERSTGSFGRITNNDLNKRVATNILDKLEGMVPGLQYDNRSGQSVINIRGINTMSDNLMGPLIVVDNFPFEGNIMDINPNDVESVTLLKDAAAASIWGARAGNGVIVINMKRPTTGEQKAKVQLSSNLSVLSKPRLYDIPQISSGDFIDLEQFLFENRHYDAQYNNVLNSRRTVFSPVVDMLYDHEMELLSDDELVSAIASFKQIDFRDGLLKYFYQDKVLQQHNTSFSGGNVKNAWSFSLGYDKNVGGIIGQKDEKITSNVQHTLLIGKKVTLALMSRFTRSQGSDNSARFDYNFSPGGGRTRLYPYARFVGDNGEALAIPNSYNLRYMEGLSDSQLLDWTYQPYGEVGNTSYENLRNHLASRLNLTYRPINGVELSLMYNNEIQNEERTTVYGENSFFARDLINRFSQISGSTVKYIVPKSAIKDSDNLGLGSHKVRGGLSFNRSFQGRLHQISAILGAEISNTSTSTTGSRYYGYNPNLLTVQAVDYINSYPIFDGLTGNSRIPFRGGFSEYINRFVSYYGNSAYTYKEKYTVSLSARKDAANIFGVNTNDRWKPLWSSGLSWTVSNENFFRNIDWLSYLKIRGTYGHSGNSGGVSSTYPRISYSNPLSLDLAGEPYAMVTSLPNPSLKWEDVRMFNVGLDFNVFGSKLSGTFEYFDKKSTDLISSDEIDPTAGMASIVRNVGVVDGNGFDLSLSSEIGIGKVKWTGNLFLSHSRSTVKEYKGRVSLADAYLLNSGTTLTPLPDKELYPVFALRFGGLDPSTGDPLGYLDGEESKNYASMLRDSLQNIIYYGTGLPPNYGSFSHNFNWKGFDLFLLMMFKFGHHFQKKTILYNSLFNSWNGHSDFGRRWKAPGDEQNTTVPSLVYPAGADRDNFYAYSEPNIEKGDVLRLQDIRISYSFSSSFSKNQMRFSIFSVLNNVGILWRANDSGLDPDYNTIPPSRRISVGLNCSF
ncbi:SusC/RagA family TonB-linked outer membrane protein [Sphingobacterium olei]|nr:SusC/RagA family TonB-linked outer membrane protein [Sphingobacterium olei]